MIATSARSLLSPALLALAALSLCACGEDGSGGGGATATGTGSGAGAGTGGSGATGGAGTGASGTGGAGASGTGGSGGSAAPCPANVTCVTTFPFHDERDTQAEGASNVDAYDCAPGTDESGPEIVYRVTVPQAGFLSAAVYDGAGVDVDVHIVSAQDGSGCLDRGDLHARADVPAGDLWIVADSFVSGGQAQAGAYSIDIGFVVPSKGPCDMEVGEMARVGDGGNHLPMPATGPMVMEAHLVTQEEPAPYPSTATDELDAHYALSQQETGFVLHRSQVWAPLEGGSFYGAGIGDPADFPVVDEGWYVNMYWTAAARPPKGTRMIVRDPNGGSRAVVVAAGYETGPGNLAHIGGTPEETHFYMGTGHLDEMQLGIAVDQALPFGPRICQ